MYEIKFIHKDETTENPLYRPGDTAYCLTAASLSLEVGAAGELSISIPDANPAKADFVCLTDELIVYRDGVELWRGRAITRQEDFYKTGTLTCEGVLAYLYDTYYPPFEFSGSPTDFLQSVLDNHNAQVEERKQLRLGTVTVEDSNDYIARSSIEYNRTLTVLTDKLVNDSLGGYFRVRIVDGVKYLDYLASYGTTATQPVEFGVNLLDIAQNVEYSDLATVILPLGAKLEDSDGNQTDEYLTISSVNGGSIYYADEAAVAEYGWIVVCNIWEDVTEASNLLTKAKNYLAQVTSAVSSFEVSAVDLALVSAEYDYINLGDYVLIRSDPHGINQYVELTAMDIDLLDPANDTLTFGADSASLTDAQRSSDRNVQTALESLSARYTNLVATAITTDYLTAKYITADDIAALYVKADSLEAEVAAFGYLTADNAKLTYATINDLTAASATIATLQSTVAEIEAAYITVAAVDTLLADYATIATLTAYQANITELLSGYVTAGEVDAILVKAGYLTADSAAITELQADVADINTMLASYATIEYLSANYATVNDLTAYQANITELLSGYVTAGEVDAILVKAGYLTADSAAITELQADVADINTMLASYATIEYLSANYATVNDLTAYRAEVTKLVAGFVTASDVTAILVEAGYLTADSAAFTDLTAEVAN
ncbi:MAG: phage tail protein, partial [Clostridiales bacterium]|nr:phage tail protein [Clostridiales bacterium]